jgi:acetylornithine deacetylase/succinyl-diaminopimelate desuccinylase-like protein
MAKNKPVAQFYDERLHEMLRYKRPHQSQTEAQWIERFLMPYEPTNFEDAAYVIVVQNHDGSDSRVMFSCHTDTVHRGPGMQRIRYDSTKQCYFKDDKEPLGADDAAGAWVMLEMIDAGVPGTYMFHRGEECGGLGSKYIASKHTDFLDMHDYAIAFDRRGSTSVITHQGYGRCCSDEFAQALADAINEDGVSMYAPDDTGVFTDTANYTEDIPECTNLACGYANEHSGNETLHLPTLFALRDACLRIDWASLPVARDPAVVERYDFNKLYGGYDFGGYDYKTTGSGKGAAYKLLYTMSRSEMLDMAYSDPETFVAMVREELFDEVPKRSARDDYEIGDYESSFKYY